MEKEMPMEAYLQQTMSPSRVVVSFFLYGACLGKPMMTIQDAGSRGKHEVDMLHQKTREWHFGRRRWPSRQHKKPAWFPGVKEDDDLVWRGKQSEKWTNGRRDKERCHSEHAGS